MAAPERQRGALQLIFAFFLGLMVTAFIGVGVYTFYPESLDTLEGQARELRSQQQEIREARTAEGLTDEHQAELSVLSDELQANSDQIRERREDWARTTSIILILLATFVMGISLVRADQLPVINNGLLLGGVFTMLYGTGWTLASGDSRLRFWVMAFALLITLVLGYVRFVRAKATSPASPASLTPITPPEVGDLTSRVDALERKIDAAAEVMKRT